MKCHFFHVYLFLFFSISGYSIDSTYTRNCILKINASQYKNQQARLNYPFFGTTIQIDDTGNGSVTLSVTKMLFTELKLNETNVIPLFLTPGDELSLKIENNNSFFTGKGCDANNYLRKAYALLKQLRDSIASSDDSPEKFLSICNSFESRFHTFHRRFSDSVSFSKEVAHLLKNEIDALALNEKQVYLSRFSMNDIDSLKLESRLGIDDKNLYQDTLLMKTGSSSYKVFLFANLDFEMKKIITPEKIEKGLYPLLSTTFIQSQRYSASIQEFLLFTNITVMIQSLGLTPEIDSIARKLSKEYPSSEYLSHLLKRYKEFEYLLPGKDAPDFTAVALDNKSYSLKDFNGKIVLIDVWATWCKPCIASFPSVQNLQEVFKDKPVIFLFISGDREEEKWKAFLSNYKDLKGIHFRMYKTPFYDAYKIAGLPRYILIDQKGKIVNGFATYTSEKLRNTIDGLLK